MSTAEEKELKKATTDFEKAIVAFKEKKFADTEKLLEKLIMAYQESEYYSSLEIVGRAKAYLQMCQYQQAPSQESLESKEDKIYAALYALNQGDYNQVLTLLDSLDDPQVNYLMSIAHSKLGEQDKSLECLAKSINDDPAYRYMAYNESDLESLRDHPTFRSLTE